MPTRLLSLFALLAAACGGSSSDIGAIRCSSDADCGGAGACVSGLCPSSAALTASALTSTLLISTTAPAYGTSGLPLPAGLSSGNKATILVTLKTSSGAAVGAGQSVTLSSDGSNNSIWPQGGAIVANNAVGTTNGGGVAIFYMTSTTAQTKNLTATINTAPGFTLTGTQLFMTAAGVALANSSFTASPISPATIAANGVAASTLTTTVHDAFGNPIAGRLVTYACTSGCATLAYSPAAAGNTNALGVYTATVASTTPENTAIKSTIQGVAPLALAPNYLQFVATAPSAPTLTATTTTVVADGIASSTLTGTVTDQFGNPLSGQVIDFNNPGLFGILSPESCITGASGSCAVGITSYLDVFPYALGPATITATANGLTSGPVVINFIASGVVSQTLSTLTVSPPSVPADSVTPLTITLTLLDTTGGPMAGSSVSINGSGGNVSLTHASGTTNSAGVFTATDVSNHAQTVQFTSASTGYVAVPGTFTAISPASPPGAPTGLTTSGACNTGSISLSWNPSATANWYHVYRATTPGGPYTLIYSPQWTSQVDSTVAANTSYYYVVKASNAAGYGPASLEVALHCGGPPPPTDVAVSGDCSSAPTVTWTASPTATSYAVWSTTDSAGPYTQLIASTTATSFTDTSAANNTSTYYVVTASNSTGASLYSSPATMVCAPDYCGGLGKLGAPYLICNAAAFEYMASSGDAFFQQGRTSPLWTPRSFQQTASFTLDSSWYPFEMDNVIYDGNGYTITYNISSYPAGAPRGYLGLPDNIGLFSTLNYGATIKNLNIVGSITGAGTNAGLLCGAVNNDNPTPVNVTHVRASGTVSAYFNPGGLIGTVYSGGYGDYTSISANATVIATASGGDEGDNSVGGLIGAMQNYSPPDLRLEDCAASGSISSAGGVIGGIVGEGISLELRRCVSTTSLPAASGAGGLLGQDDFHGNVNSDSHWSLGTAASSGFGSDGSGTSGESLSNLLDGANTATNYPGWDFTFVWFPPNGTNAATLR